MTSDYMKTYVINDPNNDCYSNKILIGEKKLEFQSF